MPSKGLEMYRRPMIPEPDQSTTLRCFQVRLHSLLGPLQPKERLQPTHSLYLIMTYGISTSSSV